MGKGRRTLRDTFGQNVRAYRTKLGISQEELAHRAGIHRTYMSSVERAQRNVSIDNIERIARALGIDASALLA